MDSNLCVIFSQRAFNAIVTETISKHPIETGGILIGYVLDNGSWIVVENVSPGFKSIHKTAYFEYDAQFVTYLANTLANQYKGNIKVLGLWHRHPGSMDIFSNTDVATNIMFARNNPAGAISALVNCDPQLRLTMYHVDASGNSQSIDWIIDDGNIIPEHFLALRYSHDSDMPIFDCNGVVKTHSALINESIKANEATVPVQPNRVDTSVEIQNEISEDERTKDEACLIEVAHSSCNTESIKPISTSNDSEDQHLKQRGWSYIKKSISSIFCKHE